MIISDALILPILLIQTHQVMTSLIRSQIVIKTVINFNTDLSYSCAHFVVEIVALMAGFNTT